MKWRFVDKIERFEAWKEIIGLKAVTLEEYSLLERFDRNGVFPESLVLEACVHLSRWLIARSSDFQQNACLATIRSFVLHGTVETGQILRITGRIAQRDDQSAWMECCVEVTGKVLAEGCFEVALSPLKDDLDPAFMKSLWGEIFAKA